MIGQLLDRRYKIIQALSAGGFGHTYIAEDLRIPGHPQCVVKYLKPASNNPKLLATAERLFWTEAESLAQLGNHHQIPRILDFFEENQEFFLVQEYVEGHLLSEELTPGKKLSESYVIDLLKDVLPVLEFIHQRDVIHRDIKPDNIIRRQQDNKLVLIDFGAVKQVRSFATTVQDRQARATVSIGTPGYMSTEQGRGKPRSNSDIYGLGMIAIQALTGLEPFDLEEDSQTGEILWQQHASVSPGLAEVLDLMVRYHFKDRYQSATEVLQALQQLEYPSDTPTVQATLEADTPVREYVTQLQNTTQLQDMPPYPKLRSSAVDRKDKGDKEDKGDKGDKGDKEDKGDKGEKVLYTLAEQLRRSNATSYQPEVAPIVEPYLAPDVEPSSTPPPTPPTSSSSSKFSLMLGLGVAIAISAIASFVLIILPRYDNQDGKTLNTSSEEQLHSQQCRVVSPSKGQPTAKVRVQPLRDAEITTFLDRDTKVLYLGEQGAFVEIQLADGSKGWVFNDQLQPCP